MLILDDACQEEQRARPVHRTAGCRPHLFPQSALLARICHPVGLSLFSLSAGGLYRRCTPCGTVASLGPLYLLRPAAVRRSASAALLSPHAGSDSCQQPAGRGSSALRGRMATSAACLPGLGAYLCSADAPESDSRSAAMLRCGLRSELILRVSNPASRSDQRRGMAAFGCVWRAPCR